MNAINFIKQHGVDKAKEVVEGAPDGATHIRDSYGYVAYLKDGVNKEWYHDNTWLMALIWQPDYLLSEIKRVVDSLDLVKSYGGIINAKYDVKYLDLDWDYDTPRIIRLKQAIADYESIGGEHV